MEFFRKVDTYIRVSKGERVMILNSEKTGFILSIDDNATPTPGGNGEPITAKEWNQFIDESAKKIDSLKVDLRKFKGK